MNKDTKHLLNLKGISPPSSVQTERDVIEYLLECNEDLQLTLSTIGILSNSNRYKSVNINQATLECVDKITTRGLYDVR